MSRSSPDRSLPGRTVVVVAARSLMPRRPTAPRVVVTTRALSEHDPDEHTFALDLADEASVHAAAADRRMPPVAEIRASGGLRDLDPVKVNYAFRPSARPVGVITDRSAN